MRCTKTLGCALAAPSPIMIMHRRALYRFILSLICIACFSTFASAQSAKGVCPTRKIEAELLPNLNTPRGGHRALRIGDEVVVFGGHTSGFVPSQTAEYYANGTWHEMKMVYPHDQPVTIQLRSGKVLIGGGHEQHLGIGQLFAVELYDPATHTFEGYGCMDRKRSLASAIEADSGKVYISGNWYNEDGLECYNGNYIFQPVKDVSQHREMPYMFRTSKENFLIFSSHDIHGKAFDTIFVDRLQGAPYVEPFLQTWRPKIIPYGFNMSDSFIGNESRGEYTYLFMVENSKEQQAIARLRGSAFELLPTDAPVPTERNGEKLKYFSSVIVNRAVGRAYVVACSKSQRFYVLCIDYSNASRAKPAHLSLFETQPITNIGESMPVLTKDGDLLLTGGITDNNFTPYAGAVLLPLGQHQRCAIFSPSWMWGSLGLALLTGLGSIILLLRYRQRKGANKRMKDERTEIDEADSKEAIAAANSGNLMARIDNLMKTRCIFLESKLKVSDVAEMLGTDTRSVSTCIKTQRETTFSAYVNNFRIDYAKQLLRENPERKMAALCTEVGFSNETSFFRTFKALTGMTPGEWIAEDNSNRQ